ncbi:MULTISPECIES: RDD family protein [Pseudoxanthomonas]|uniref:RDD family membrane protein YckC n=1 Tax=Pseudoxanthomonas winnipegensis TaxID=2480810 RepID=A0AAW8GFN4_9GAMM|nr:MULTISPECIES: RDD family protein [Pseudoxanthomonas]MDQ1121259.1 putative RDD family membrane protein YckC [Pseudoxanthomonas winnipegensis]MDQ1134493.1 putative RDD family membrane protein YckC [Pseudoxanthomonas winnipegensis]MDR6139278.1 putative RDD family membrane protein YckC [Pseudoxanthomonas sp. SORGH_AS_0997]
MTAIAQGAAPAVVLDTVREVVTPEGVSLQLPAAGPVPRAVAWGVDLVVRVGMMFAATMVLGLLGKFGDGLSLVAAFLLQWGYMIVLEALWHGQTLGKRAMRLRVVLANGAPIGWPAAITRNLLRVVDMLPFGYAAGLVVSLIDPSARRLGDLAAGTLVIHAEHAEPPASAPVNAVVVPRATLRPAEQAAIVAFGERAPQLTPERQVELAELLEPLTGARGPAGVLRLFGMANWLLGRR